MPLAFLGLFLFWPLARILGLGLRPLLASGWPAILEAARSTGLGRLAAASAAQSLASTALSLLLGLPAAYVFARFAFVGRRLVRLVLLVPFVLPPVVVAAAFNALAGPGGLAELAASAAAGRSVPLAFRAGLAPVIAAHVFYNVSIVVRIVGDAWAGLDPRLGEAARVLGAGRSAAVRLSLRLLAPAIAAAALLVFSYCFTSFGVVLILGGARVATLETEIWHQAVHLLDFRTAALLALLQLAVTGAAMAGYGGMERRLAAVLRSAPVPRSRAASAGTRALVALFGYGLPAALALPLLALVAGSFAGRSGLTVAAWTSLLRNATGSLFWTSPLDAARTSLAFAAAAVAVALAVGLPSAYLAAGLRRGGERPRAAAGIVDLAVLLPLGTSALTLGFGFLVALDRPPFDLRASPLLVPMAHALVALPLVTRSLVPPLASLDRRLRESAGTLGAPPLRAWLTIDLPILARAIVTAAAFAFTVSVGEFAATALLARPEHATIPVLIYRRLATPGEVNRGQALAMSSILMVVCALGIGLIERLRSREGS